MNQEQFFDALNLPAQLQLPRELNATMWQILGRPNFSCSPIAGVLRRHGAQIECRAESEQAFVLHLAMCCYLAWGDQWFDQLQARLKNFPDRPADRG